MKDKASGKKRREEEEQVHSTVERDLTDKAGDLDYIFSSTNQLSSFDQSLNHSGTQLFYL